MNLGRTAALMILPLAAGAPAQDGMLHLAPPIRLPADVDADGLMDIVTADDTSLAVTLVRGVEGGFAPPESLPLHTAPTDLDHGDLDGDGSGDVLCLTSGTQGTVLHVFETSPGGTLEAQLPISVGGPGGSRMVPCDLDQDDRLDLAVILSADDELVVLLNAAPWWSHGGGHAAIGVVVPHLVGSGDLRPESETSLDLSGASPSSPAFLVVGLSRVFLPLKGGVLVPSPDLIVPALATDASGSLHLSGRWPMSLPVGTQLTFQFWIASAAGFASSNAVSAEQP